MLETLRTFGLDRLRGGGEADEAARHFVRNVHITPGTMIKGLFSSMRASP